MLLTQEMKERLELEFKEYFLDHCITVNDRNDDIYGSAFQAMRHEVIIHYLLRVVEAELQRSVEEIKGALEEYLMAGSKEARKKASVRAKEVLAKLKE